MKQYYNEAIQMIKMLNEKLSREQYYKIAKKFDLLSPESLEYMAQKEFIEIVDENIT